MKQYTYSDLEEMRNIDIRDFDRNSIPYTELPVIDRILDFIHQSKNPYFYRSDNDMLVQIEYSETDITIEDCMEAYFELVMQCPLI